MASAHPRILAQITPSDKGGPSIWPPETSEIAGSWWWADQADVLGLWRVLELLGLNEGVGTFQNHLFSEFGLF